MPVWGNCRVQKKRFEYDCETRLLKCRKFEKAPSDYDFRISLIKCLKLLYLGHKYWFQTHGQIFLSCLAKFHCLKRQKALDK